ncbi:MAG: DoxX family protein [Bacteroidales bacterium]|jgi:putative oxidoreductase|nr:DoxX family protein [Bacteroidales bacterium]
MKKQIVEIVTVLLGKENSKANDIGLLLFRIIIGAFMLTHGLSKLSMFEELKATFPDPLGVGSATSLVLILLAEVGCSLLVILGAFTRLAVLPLMFGMCIAAFIIHGSDPFATKESALFYLSMYVVLACVGGGKFSVDYLLRKKLERLSD